MKKYIKKYHKFSPWVSLPIACGVVVAFILDLTIINIPSLYFSVFIILASVNLGLILISQSLGEND